MSVEEIIKYGSMAIGGLVILLLLIKLMKKSDVKSDKKVAERNWTLTPPTSALPISQMKSSNPKGVNKKNILVDNTSKPKAASWKNTASFEEDVSQINLDVLMNKKVNRNIENRSGNAFEKRSNSNTDLINEKQNVLKQEYKIKVLLVDDSAVILKKTGDMLKNNGYEVITKKDGSEAIIWLEENLNVPDVIITDMEMPKMTGEELVEAMRAEKRFQEVPVLVISAHAERHIGLMEKQMIQGFLKKPFTESDLISQIEFFLG